MGVIESGNFIGMHALPLLEKMTGGFVRND